MVILQEINRELLEIKEEQWKIKKLKRQLDSIEGSRTAERWKRRDLKEQLDKEKYDVNQLEGVGLTSLFYTVLGGKDEKIKKEKHEFLEAKLKYDACCEFLEEMVEEEKQLNSEIKMLENRDIRYAELLQQKETWLRDQNDSRVIGLDSIAEELVGAQAECREIKEALQVGNTSQKVLKNVLKTLSSAKNWGTFDLLGGGLIATAVKHGKIDTAQKEARKAQWCLRKFERELKDVPSIASGKLVVEVGSFLTFSDYFFDGLIVDWMVQSKIKKTYASVKKVETQLSVTLRSLDEHLTTMTKKTIQLNKEYESILDSIR